jgi:hypothetical protein
MKKFILCLSLAVGVFSEITSFYQYIREIQLTYQKEEVLKRVSFAQIVTFKRDGRVLFN